MGDYHSIRKAFAKRQSIESKPVQEEEEYEEEEHETEFEQDFEGDEDD